jgi:hypothetical protein
MFRILTRTALMVFTVGASVACHHAAKDEEEAVCRARKPGVIVSVNEYCPVQLADPVDPTIVREWKGQKVSFCCDGCLPAWEEMTEKQRDTALAAAVAKGRIPE